VQGFREIAERLARPESSVRVRVWLACGPIEGVLEFVDGPLWVVADRGSRTWVDEAAVLAVTLLDAVGVADALAESAAHDVPGQSSLRVRLDDLAERFDCRVSGEPPSSDEARVAMGRLLTDLEPALRRVCDSVGDSFLEGGLDIELGDPGVRRVNGVLLVAYRPGPRGRLDLDRLVAALQKAATEPS
jgi:hypothetical protein